jgi:hypothetical protein
MICLVLALQLACFDGKHDMASEKCNEPKEMAYLACMKYPDCSMEGPVNMGYISESWAKKHKIEWCKE